MKRSIVILLAILFINYFNLDGKPAGAGGQLSASDSIKVISSPDLYKLSANWVNEYIKLNPGAKIKVISVPDSKIAEDFSKDGSIGLLSNGYYSRFDDQSVLKLVVGRDILVPVISSKNPFLEEISRKGVSPENFVAFFSNQNSGKWETLLTGAQKASANYYFINDNSVTNDIRKFLKIGNTELKGIQVENSDDMVTAIQNDPYAFGFCRLTSILDIRNQSLAGNLRFLPIDRNNNGILDYNEKIYEDYNNFSRAVWIGKYPQSLISNIYAVSSLQPKNQSEIAFMKWIFGEGQKMLLPNGYTDILVSERQTAIDKINTSQVYTASVPEESSILGALLFTAGFILLAVLLIDLLLKYRRRVKSTVHRDKSSDHKVLDENSLVLPKGLYYDKTHTWAFIEQNGVVKVGIDDFLQHITGTFTRLKLKQSGDKVEKGEVILTLIQNGKQLNIYAPVSGTIMEANSSLNANASLINSSPYNEGWVYKIEPSNWFRENQLLFVADKHRQFIKNEFIRLKDFLVSALAKENEKYALLVLQDGGELIDNTLSSLGPEVWDDFQTQFIDPSRQIWFYELF